jgi:hypothetical protein
MFNGMPTSLLSPPTAQMQSIEQQRQDLLQKLHQLDQIQRNSPVTEDRVIQLINERMGQLQQTSAMTGIIQKIGEAMTEDQQKIISANLAKLPDFLKTSDGKAVIQMIADALQQQ